MDRREVFLAGVDVINRGDLSQADELLHPKFVLHPIRTGLTGEYVGRSGLQKFLADTAETFEVFEAGYDDIRELPDGRLFASGKIRIRGKGSHVEDLVPTAGIATFEEGRIASWYDYGDRAQALEAAGLA